MTGTSNIRGCYAYNGNLVLLSEGELGIYVHHRRCEDSHNNRDQIQPDIYPVNNISTKERSKMAIKSR